LFWFVWQRHDPGRDGEASARPQAEMRPASLQSGPGQSSRLAGVYECWGYCDGESVFGHFDAPDVK